MNKGKFVSASGEYCAGAVGLEIKHYREGFACVFGSSAGWVGKASSRWLGWNNIIMIDNFINIIPNISIIWLKISI